jgi:hypothetical protein
MTELLKWILRDGTLGEFLSLVLLAKRCYVVLHWVTFRQR